MPRLAGTTLQSFVGIPKTRMMSSLSKYSETHVVAIPHSQHLRHHVHFKWFATG